MLVETISTLLNYAIMISTSTAGALSIVFFKVKRQSLYAYISAYFYILTILEFFVRESEIQSDLYVRLHAVLNSPITCIRVCIYTVISVVLICIFKIIFPGKLKLTAFAPSAVMLVWMNIFYLVINPTALSSWLFILPVQLFMIGYAVIVILRLRREKHMERSDKLKQCMAGVIVFEILILAEDTIVSWLAWHGVGVNIVHKTLEYIVPARNYSESVEYIFLAVFYLKALLEELEKSQENTIPEEKTECENNEDKNVYVMLFAKKYGVSVREEDVLRLMLMNCSYNEISNTLHIAEGTVKAHTHSIMQKTESSNRKELSMKYEEFIRNSV